MTISDKIFLLKNGYTKEEVEAMAAEEKNVSENDKNGGATAEIHETPTEDNKADVTENDKEPKPEPKPEESETDKLIKALGLKLDNAISAIHKSNVNNLEGAGNEQITVEDVLAQVINPNYKGGKN